MKPGYTLLFLAIVLCTSCHKKSTTVTVPPALPTTKPVATVLPYATPAIPGTLVTTVTYPYTDTFYGHLRIDYIYYGGTKDTMVTAYVIHPSATTVRFSSINGFNASAVYFGDYVTVNASNYYYFPLSSNGKDHCSYKFSHDTLFYNLIDTHGVDYDVWNFSGKKI